MLKLLLNYYIQAELNNMTCFVKQEVPPLPRRSRHFDSAPLNDQDGVLYAHLKKQSPGEIPRSQNICQENLPGYNPRKAQKFTTLHQNHMTQCSPPSRPDSVYSELSLLESSKSRSLPLLDSTSEKEQYYRLNAPPHKPPRLSPKPNKQATNCVSRSEKIDLCSRQSSSHSLDYITDSAIYHLASRPGSPHTTSSETRTMASGHHSDSVYAEVSNVLSPYDNTYELIAGIPKPNSNTYEPLEEIRPKPIKVSNVF